MLGRLLSGWWRLLKIEKLGLVRMKALGDRGNEALYTRPRHEASTRSRDGERS